MSKFTPCSWHYEGNTVYALESAGWYRGVERMQNRFYALVQSAHTPSSELEANARLIAAAPELLEALESLCTLESALTQEKWDSAREAIAKARGDA